MNRPERGPTARGKWYLKPLRAGSKADMMDLGYLSGKPMIKETDIGMEDEIYLVTKDIVSSAKESPADICYRAYWQSSPRAKLIHRPQFSRTKGRKHR